MFHQVGVDTQFGAYSTHLASACVAANKGLPLDVVSKASGCLHHRLLARSTLHVRTSKTTIGQTILPSCTLDLDCLLFLLLKDAVSCEEADGDYALVDDALPPGQLHRIRSTKSPSRFGPQGECNRITEFHLHEKIRIQMSSICIKVPAFAVITIRARFYHKKNHNFPHCLMICCFIMHFVYSTSTHVCLILIALLKMCLYILCGMVMIWQPQI